MSKINELPTLKARGAANVLPFDVRSPRVKFASCQFRYPCLEQTKKQELRFFKQVIKSPSIINRNWSYSQLKGLGREESAPLLRQRLQNLKGRW